MSLSRRRESSVTSQPRLKVTVGLVMWLFCMFRAMTLRIPVMGFTSSLGASSAAGLEAAARISAARMRPPL